MTEQGIRKLLSLEIAPGSPAVIVYAEQITNRLHYVCRFIFENVLKIKYVITSGRDEFEASDFYKINYSPEIIDSSLRIIPHSLLFDKGVPAQQPESFLKNGQLYFYENKDGDLHFDIFSAVFYMIARCEEWQPFEPDGHNRFELKESRLYKHNKHLQPVVDEWIMELRKTIAFFFSGIILPVLKPKTISTIDVDNLYAYANKGFTRTAGASVKDVLKGDFKNLTRRAKVLRGEEKDPFDIYESFTRYCNEINVAVFYFFLFRSGTAYDRTVDPSSPAFKKVFTAIKKEGGYIGVHPSYYSSGDETVLRSEIKHISSVLGEAVGLSRQHYLKFDIKKTPAQLVKNGIHTDFTMGFASGAGFRAGTSHAFYYFDLNKEEELPLLFVPFCAMDGAYTVYNNLSPHEALHTLEKLKKEVEKVNGLFVTVFHERTFADHLYPGFSHMYKELLK